jgi:hypothetical protein
MCVHYFADVSVLFISGDGATYFTSSLAAQQFDNDGNRNPATVTPEETVEIPGKPVEPA